MELFRNNDSIFMQISLVVKKKTKKKKTHQDIRMVSKWKGFE